ncbi:MAG: phosphoenolpyruvate carboxykinase (ATP) [Bacteroidales bacterium]|nr:phosphoenolpyruvate carboxykinase (ATP) [Bacteroidales bacterium]
MNKKIQYIQELIKHKPVFANLTYEELRLHETTNEDGFEKVYVASSKALIVRTGKFTGRSPKDKYVVMDDHTSKLIWWAGDKPEARGSDNHPMSIETWNHLFNLCTNHIKLSDKPLYVMDVIVGARPEHSIRARIITEIAWAAHFAKNMFISPKHEELNHFEPDVIMLHLPRCTNPNWKEQGLNSEVFVAFNFSENMILIGGTWYGGEIKKAFFTWMNYHLPLRGVASMHCSANAGTNGDTALFFGLSGTGKTTLSSDPDRWLIGDDEHGWDDEGIFNFEGGCYAKCIHLSSKLEPDIYQAIRENAILENVVFDSITGNVDYDNDSITENTRASFPIYHLQKIVPPPSIGRHPSIIIFLTADAFGVFPPVAKLTREQAIYYYLGGFTSKLAGTERGIIEPKPTFSACFGAAFLPLPPIRYAEELVKKIDQYHTSVYLVNTGWIEGPYGIGHRIPLPITRKIIKGILDGTIEREPFIILNHLQLSVPKQFMDLDLSFLNPRNTWTDKSAYDAQLKKLSQMFSDYMNIYKTWDEKYHFLNAGLPL